MKPTLQRNSAQPPLRRKGSIPRRRARSFLPEDFLPEDAARLPSVAAASAVSKHSGPPAICLFRRVARRAGWGFRARRSWRRFADDIIGEVVGRRRGIPSTGETSALERRLMCEPRIALTAPFEALATHRALEQALAKAGSSCRRRRRRSAEGTGGCYRSSARVPAMRRSEVRIPSAPPGSPRKPA
jgi:hypothetical protein